MGMEDGGWDKPLAPGPGSEDLTAVETEVGGGGMTYLRSQQRLMRARAWLGLHGSLKITHFRGSQREPSRSDFLSLGFMWSVLPLQKALSSCSWQLGFSHPRSVFRSKELQGSAAQALDKQA